MTLEDLFSTFSDSSNSRLPMAEADVSFFPSFYSLDQAHELFSSLRKSTEWKAVQISVWGKRVMQPRLVCWHGDPGATYKYSGVRFFPEPWTDTLQLVREKVERVANTTFNSVLLNLYRDQNDSMGWHSDDEPELGDRPTIASLSLGATRDFLLRHKSRKDIPQVSLPLSSGSLLVMAGSTQKYWAHSIRKETLRIGPRINLTFRKIV